METLHTEPARDQFKSESPIRAFTDWSTQGNYALGKGFRPSLSHVVPYMDAMEAKEGWRLVQILEAGTQTPSFMFRREREIDVDVMIDRLASGTDEGFRQRVKEWLGTGTMRAGMKAFRVNHPGSDFVPLPYLSAADPRKIAIGLRQVTGEMECYFRGDEVALPYDDWVRIKDHVMTFVDRLNGYAAELHEGVDQHTAGFEEAADKIDAARTISMTMDDINPDNLRAAFFGESLGEPYRAPGRPTVADLMEAGYDSGNQPDFGAPHDVPLLIVDEKEHQSSAVYRAGRWNVITNMIDADNFTAEPMATLPMGWRERPQDPWMVCDIYKVVADAITPEVASDDPLNPKHYHGRECADIGELLTANSYQILKYNWRLGEKDSPCVELGKALWYLDSEMALYGDTDKPACHALPEYGWFDEKLRHATDHAKGVARILISWNRYGNRHSLRGLRKLLQAQLDGLNGCTDWGRGLEP